VIEAGRVQASEDNVLSFPVRHSAAPSADALSVIAVLQDQLELARSGKLRSIALASVSSDGRAVVTRCSCARGDVVDVVDALRVLADDMVDDDAGAVRTA
jgi:hypothetical protein